VNQILIAGCVFHSKTFINAQLLNVQLIRTHYAPKHSQDRGNLEYVSRVAVDCKRTEFVGNKQTNKHTNTQLYLL